MYNEVRENIQKTNRTMDNKRESLGELRKKTDEAQAKVEVAQRTEGDRTRLEGLEREKAWALVDEKQKVGVDCLRLLMRVQHLALVI
jgi:hypothetical protein